MRWLALSLGLSVLLTVVANIALRWFPDAAAELTRRLTQISSSQDDPQRRGPHVRVFVPWKAMIVASVVLTVAANLIL